MANVNIFPTTIEKILFLKNVDIFSETIPESLLNVASIANEFSVAKGEEIFAEGDPSVYLYLVVTGEIRITRKEREIFLAGANESFGLVGLVEERRRATGRSADDAPVPRPERRGRCVACTGRRWCPPGRRRPPRRRSGRETNDAEPHWPELA